MPNYLNFFNKIGYFGRFSSLTDNGCKGVLVFLAFVTYTPLALATGTGPLLPPSIQALMGNGCVSALGSEVSAESVEGYWKTFTASNLEVFADYATNDDASEWGDNSLPEWGSLEMLYANKFLQGYEDGHGHSWSPGSISVFFSSSESGAFSIPEVAIFIRDGEVHEVRGFGAHQNLNPRFALSDVLSDRLFNFVEMEMASPDLFDAAKDAQRLVRIAIESDSGEAISEKDLRFLYEIDRPIETGFGYRSNSDEDGLREMKVVFGSASLGYTKNPLVEEIKAKRDLNADMKKVLSVEEDEILVVTEGQEVTFDDLEGVKLVVGDLDLKGLRPGQRLHQIVVLGDLYVLDEEVEEVTLPRLVTGDTYFHPVKAVGVVLPRKTRKLRMLETREFLKSRMPRQLVELELRSLENFEASFWFEEVESLGVSEKLLPKIVDHFSEFTVRERLTVYGSENGGTFNPGSKLENVVIPNIEGGHYYLGSHSLSGVKFEADVVKSVGVAAQNISNTFFPRMLSEDLDLALAAEIMDSRLPKKVNGDADADVGSVVLYKNGSVELSGTTPIRSVGRNFDGAKEAYVPKK